MTIQVLYFAGMRDLFQCARESVDLQPGATLGDLKELLFSRKPEGRLQAASLAWGVNFEFSGLQTALQDGDEVAMLPPVSGGSQA
ncbi:MAG: MoaD/ThiS family protein [candidate division FCPU426 bacterium]